jgi:hypothetical protein
MGNTAKGKDVPISAVGTTTTPFVLLSQHFVWREEIFTNLLLLTECVSLFGILSIAALMGDPDNTEFLSDKLAVFSKVVYFRTLGHKMTASQQRMA